MLTLRQIEVIRAVTLTGSIAGASRLLNVAQPGLSRTLKHIDGMMRVKLFTRKGGRYVPSKEARFVFDQIQEVNRKVNDLNYAIERLSSGTDVDFTVGSVPSIANVVVPSAIARLCRTYPQLNVNLDIIKVEDCVDYLLMGKSELVLVSYRVEHAGLAFDALAPSKLVCIAPPDHELSKRREVSAREIAQFPLVGIEPRDPYGQILIRLLTDRGIDYQMRVKARSGATVCALVKENLGVAILDAFTVADSDPCELAVIPIVEPTTYQTYVARRADTQLSTFAEAFINTTRKVMNDIMSGRSVSPRLRPST